MTFYSTLNASLLYPFRVISSYSSKLVNLTYPTCIWRPRVGLFRVNFAEIFGIRKLRFLGYRVTLFV